MMKTKKYFAKVEYPDWGRDGDKLLVKPLNPDVKYEVDCFMFGKSSTFIELLDVNGKPFMGAFNAISFGFYDEDGNRVSRYEIKKYE